jgi:2-polyprenyl-6-methoxyphenol hydroxylase-like FAD-dependent oxidoreductase
VLAKFLNGSEKLYNFCALRTYRKKVQRALLEEASAQGIEVRYGMKLIGVDEDADTVRLSFENGQVETADFVIGADGIHSRVRPFVTSSEPVFSGYLGITGHISRDQLHESEHRYHLPNQFFGQSGFIAVMPASFDGEEVGFFSTLEYPCRSRAEWDELANRRDKIRDIFTERFTIPPWPDLIKGICKEINPATLDSWP